MRTTQRFRKPNRQRFRHLTISRFLRTDTGEYFTALSGSTDPETIFKMACYLRQVKEKHLFLLSSKAKAVKVPM